MQSTIIVIVTTVIASGFLGVFDAVWSWVTRMIYG
jgi:preprotein translocase SecE subunit